MIKRQLNQFSINYLLYCLYGSSSWGELSLAVKLNSKWNSIDVEGQEDQDPPEIQ